MENSENSDLEMETSVGPGDGKFLELRSGDGVLHHLQFDLKPEELRVKLFNCSITDSVV